MSRRLFKIDPDLPDADRALLSSVRRAAENPQVALNERAAHVLDIGIDRHRMCERKKKIRTPEHAEALIKLIREHHGKEMEAYRCPLCDAIHLTTKRTA